MNLSKDNLPSKCETCNDELTEFIYCIKCGKCICETCIDVRISDWESVCRECGW